MSTCFVPEKWVVALDLKNCAYSRKQLEHMKRMRDERPSEPFMRAIDCSDDKNARVDLCENVRAFPALCDESKGRCVYGVRETRAELEAACASMASTTSSVETSKNASSSAMVSM